MSHRGAPPIRRGCIPGGPDDPREAQNPRKAQARLDLCQAAVRDRATGLARQCRRRNVAGPLCALHSAAQDHGEYVAYIGGTSA